MALMVHDYMDYMRPTSAIRFEPRGWRIAAVEADLFADEMVFGFEREDGKRKKFRQPLEAWRATHPRPPVLAVQELLNRAFTALTDPVGLRHRLAAIQSMTKHKRLHTSPRRWQRLYGETLTLAEQRGLIAPISPAEQLFGPARRRRPWRK